MKTLGTSFPKYSLRACYSDPLILSPMMNNFVFVVSFCTFSTQPGCLFDHLRIYRKTDSKKVSSSTNGSKLASFSSIRWNATFRVQYISYIFQIYKKSFLKLGMLMKFRLRILCPLSLNSYKTKTLPWNCKKVNLFWLLTNAGSITYYWSNNILVSFFFVFLPSVLSW